MSLELYPFTLRLPRGLIFLSQLKIAKHFSAKGSLLPSSYLRYRGMIISALAKLKGDDLYGTEK